MILRKSLRARVSFRIFCWGGELSIIIQMCAKHADLGDLGASPQDLFWELLL